VTAEHFAYLAERTVREDEFLQRLRTDADQAGIPAISIGPAQASMMQILLKLIDAREVVEVGTLAGYSAICMARVLGPEGRLRTIELDPEHARFAERQVAAADLAARVEVLVGPGDEHLPAIADESVDAVFLDADKSGYPRYLTEGLRMLRPRGLMMVDNAFAFGELFAEQPTDPEVEAVRVFNDLMARESRLQSVIVPLGDGFWAGVKE
jgi:predicted O-methyltransferase YrrM